MSDPKKPEGLGEAGSTLWDSLVGEFELGPHEVRILIDACKVADVIDRCDQQAANDPLIAMGSMKQPVINPAIAEARVQRALLANLLSKLKLPLSDEREAELAQARSEQGRKAVMSRKDRQ